MAREIDLESTPTRMERLGHGPQPKTSPFLKESDEWVKSVLCPVCDAPMILLKGRRGKHGVYLTYQCQAEERLGRYCLAVMTLTVGGSYLMRPGDFDVSDVGWEDVAEEAVRVDEGDKVKGALKSIESVSMPEEPPEPPWKRNVLRRVVWIEFWDMAIDSGPKVDVSSLVENLTKENGTIPGGDKRLNKVLEDLPDWMTELSGFKVMRRDGHLMIVGRTSS